MSRRLKLIVAYDGAQFAGCKAKHIATRFRITSSARSSASAVSLCALTELDERMLESTPLHSAHMSISLMSVFQPGVGRKRSTHCCPQRSAYFAADMCQTNFTRVFPQKEKFIVTEFGLLPSCRRWNMGGPGILHARSILKF